MPLDIKLVNYSHFDDTFTKNYYIRSRAVPRPKRYYITDFGYFKNIFKDQCFLFDCRT